MNEPVELERFDDTPEKVLRRRRNKKVLKWLGIGLAVLVFMAMCGALLGQDSDGTESGLEKPVPTETVTVAPEPAPVKTEAPKAPKTKSVDERFNEAWAGLDTDMTAKQGKTNAKNVCRRLDNGDDVQVIFIDLLTLTRDAETSGYILGAAAYAYCPEYEQDITEGLSSLEEASK